LFFAARRAIKSILFGGLWNGIPEMKNNDEHPLFLSLNEFQKKKLLTKWLLSLYQPVSNQKSNRIPCKQNQVKRLELK